MRRPIALAAYQAALLMAVLASPALAQQAGSPAAGTASTPSDATGGPIERNPEAGPPTASGLFEPQGIATPDNATPMGVLPAPDRPSADTGSDTDEAGRFRDRAYSAYQTGYYITAFRLATARLERDPNDAAAMTLIGELYNQGLGVPLDYNKAAEWYRLAARLGDRSALAALGLMAINGRGMEKNPAQGKAWLEEAAKRGEPTAAYNLALLLLTTGDAPDLTRAAELLRTGVDAEIGDAQHALGVLTLKGRGVPQDPVAAARLFRRAADNGSVAGEVEYAILLFNGEGVAKDEVRAARYFQRAAARGNAIAQNRLARLYAAGRGIRRNLVEAGAWHLAASAQGLTDAWLDQALRGLTPEEREKSERLAAQRTGAL